MKSTKYFLLLLSLLLFSCAGKHTGETRVWAALYSVVSDSLIVTDIKDFKKLSDSMIQNSDYFLKLNQNSVFVDSQIIRRTIFAEILDKKGAIVNSINITTNYPSEKNELIRHSLYIVGDVKLYPFNNVNELSNLYKKFDELSSIVQNDKNRI
jgi:hypothetical protein